MAGRVSLFTLLGVTTASDAADRWPRTRFLPDIGLPATVVDPSDYIPLLAYLDEAVTFVGVRPGAAPDRVGLSADVVITPRPDPRPFVLRSMPDIAFFLQPNGPGRPARLYVTQSDTGAEVVVEGLPVEIRLPHGLLMPLRSEAEDEASPGGGPDVTQAGPFEPGVYDSLQFVLSDTGTSSIFVHLRVRMTEENDVVLEPAVPISLGPCRFSGLPCRGVHHLDLFPNPRLAGDHTDDELALEWTHHRIDLLELDQGVTGVVTVRTLDLDHSRDPFKQLVERMKDGAQEVEFVLEDLAIPLVGWVTPIPVHGRFGLRRRVVTGSDEAEAYDLTLAPIEIELSRSLVDWRLKIFRLVFETPSTVVARMAVLFGTSEESDHALVLDVTDGWLLQGAWLPPNPIHAFTVANVSVSVMTTKLGVLLRDIGGAQGASGWGEHMRALLDLGVKVGKKNDDSPFGVVVPNQQEGQGVDADVVLRDLGWDLGELKLTPSLWFPEGTKLTAFDVIQMDAEEFAFVTENNGGRYVSFTGGISVFPGAGQPSREKPATPGTPGVGTEDQPNGAGLRFRRLRLKTGGTDNAATWLLDGISLFLKVDRLRLTGFGTISEFSVDGHRYRELGLGINLQFRAMGKDFQIGAQLFYGRVEGPVDNFSYWLFGFQLGYCPVGSFELRGIHMVVAGNMHPDLPAPTGRPQEMRLLQWYKDNRTAGALTVRDDRSLQRGGWKPEDRSTAAGVGADLGLSVSKALTLRTFIFFHQGATEAGMLVAVEVFAFKAKTPIGFGAIEVDLERDRWTALVGVDVDLARALGTDSDFVKGLGVLTGTVYAGNQPGTFAIGHLNDQAAWLTLRMKKSLLGAKAEVFVAFCLQISGDDGPAGIGFVISAKGGGSFGVGKVQFYATLGVIAGTWGNEASVSGVVVWAELGLRIKVFWVFSFGATVKAMFEQLGPDQPNYRRLSCEVRIETPWWLPDVTFRIERVRETAQPEAMPAISTPLVSAGARQPGVDVEALLPVTALGGGAVDERAVHAIASLRGLPVPDVDPAALDALVPVSVDSVIALDFKPALDNRTTLAETTPTDAGLQAPRPPAENDLRARYELVEIGIRRRPRFGPGAGVWTHLLAPEDSRLAGLGDLIGGGPGVHFDAAVTCHWDRDVVKGDRLDPRRLLVNAETPYSFVTGNPAVDDGHLATDPLWPCCHGKRDPIWHRLDFQATPPGQRVPAVQRFSDSDSTLHWILARPPVAVSGVPPDPSRHWARVGVAGRPDHSFATVRFDRPAFVVDIELAWARLTAGGLVVEFYRGLKLLDRRVFSLAGAAPAGPVHHADPDGITSVALRYLGDVDGEGGEQPVGAWLGVGRMRYRSVAEEAELLAGLERCASQGGGSTSGGKLAWLPNHDYEISASVRVTLDYQGSAQDAVLVQRTAFRTRGMPGLNAVPRPGDELEPYVESISPGPAPRLLYRSEPVVLAFDERFNSLVPVDRTPSPADPDERRQLLEWVLAVERTSGEPVSVTSADWVVAHRPEPLPPKRWDPPVLDGGIFEALVRRTTTTDPFRRRLETVVAMAPGCGPSDLSLHSSQVLVHRPVDPGATGEARDRWQPSAAFRVNVRRKDAPFVGRDPFEPGDETAFVPADEDRPWGTPWQLDGGSLLVQGQPSDGRRRYAVFGDDGWNHVQVHATVDPGGGAAGVAVAVAGLPSVGRALLALVDDGDRTLRIVERRGSTSRQAAGEPLPAGVVAPYALEVTAFDDRLRARVADTIVETHRGDLREGRLALVAEDGGAFSALSVESLDAYRFTMETSRYTTFQEHVGTFDGRVAPLPAAPTGAVAGLLSATAGEIAAAMAPGADREVRQRLFDRWVGELAVPLRRRTAAVSVSAVRTAGAAELLVLETPEPLAFSEDVALAVTHFEVGFPEPLPDIPKPVLAFARGLVFDREGVHGPVSSGPVATMVGAARFLVRSVEQPAGVAFRIYAIELRATPEGGRQLIGSLVEVLRPGPFSPRPPALQGMRAGHITLLDAARRRVTGFIPLPVGRHVPVPVHVLTNGSENCALVVPAVPMAPDTYRFTLTLDRARFRAESPDDTSNYRASAAVEVRL